MSIWREQKVHLREALRTFLKKKMRELTELDRRDVVEAVQGLDDWVRRGGLEGRDSGPTS